MTLPLRAKMVIGAAGTAGAAVIVASVLLGRHQGVGSLPLVATFVALVAATWLWPLLLYRGSESEAVHFDEGFLVMMVLLLPPLAVVVGFTAATVVAQVVRRRPPVKMVFNVGQLAVSVALATTVVHVLSPPDPHHLTASALAAAALGALVFFVVNSLWLAAIIATTSSSDVAEALLDGAEHRVLLVGASVVLAIIGALAVSAYSWALALAMAPFLVFRQVLAGHFRARHDRTRLHGLFEATLEAHSSMGAAEVRSAITRAARELLRCSDAVLSTMPPGEGQIGARLQVELPERWLVLSGRRREEPFDDADRALLDALAAVGSGALTNAALFEARRIEHERLTAMTTALGEGVCALDPEGRVTFANPAACELLGRDAARLITLSHADPDTLAFLTGPARRAMATRATVHTEAATFTRRDGTSFPVSFTCSPIADGTTVAGAVMAFRDITERKAFEERLSHQAFHDALTGLPNRRVFLDRLEHALRRSQRDHGVHAVLFIDVDRFKIANDSLGHQAGDHLLIAIADRMRVLLRPVDTLARFGGDEFTVLLEDVVDVEDATSVARRILDTLHTAIVVPGGHEVVASVSIGIALSAGRATADDVLHDADVAMYQAKTRGAGRFAVFDPGAMGARSSDRVDLEADLRRAIQTTGIEVFYQPLVSVQSREVSGAEALVRWRHPERGLLGPADFIALAEESGLILPLGRMVLEEACRQARLWRESTGRPWRISVNLSARQFQSPDLLADVRRILSVTGVDPAQICLEITETVAVQDLEHTIGTLNELKRLGVKLAIDDFGTGYSSLSYLKRFPVDVVKIDRVFVKDLGESPVDSAIVAAVIDLASVVGMQVVAEGVETIEQLNHLEMLGCAIVQGFLFGRPVPEPDMTRLLRPLDESIPLPLAIAG